MQNHSDLDSGAGGGVQRHTPGPWSVEKARIHFYIRSRTRYIAMVSFLRFKGSGWTSEHDANLIAAAPDMLEALGRVLVTFQESSKQHEINALNEVRAAIDKAQGGAA